MCELCRGGGNKCVDCVMRERQALPDANGRAKLATWALIAGAVTDGLGAVISALTVAFAGNSQPTDLNLFDVANGLTGLAQTVVFITTGVLFLRWWHLMVRHAEARGIQVGATPGWAVGYWFVPFANLVRPVKIASAAANGFGVTAPIGAWWALWILSNIASQVSARMNLSEMSTGGGNVSAVADLIDGLLSVPAALLCVAVIRAIQKGIDAANAQPRSSAGLPTAA